MTEQNGTHRRQKALGEPRCNECGYVLSGLIDSSKCPECGRPLVEVLTRESDGPSGHGKRYRSEAMLWGMPAIDVALGPSQGQAQGRARGFLAIGDDAVGVVAIGGVARGGIAIGGAAMGVFSIGGFSMGLLTAIGGCAIGGMATGGMAMGAIAKGGAALGVVAEGAAAVGYYARGAGALGQHVITASGGGSPVAARVFDNLSWLLGHWSGGVGALLDVVRMASILAGTTVLVGVLLSVVALKADRRAPHGDG